MAAKRRVLERFKKDFGTVKFKLGEGEGTKIKAGRPAFSATDVMQMFPVYEEMDDPSKWKDKAERAIAKDFAENFRAATKREQGWMPTPTGIGITLTHLSAFVRLSSTKSTKSNGGKPLLEILEARVARRTDPINHTVYVVEETTREIEGSQLDASDVPF